MLFFRNAKHRRFVAWLALAAIWLTIGMPVISQVVASSSGSSDLGTWCTGHGLHNHHAGHPTDPVSPTDKCGYCSLFCHSPLVLGHADLALSSLALPAPVLIKQAVPAGPAPRLLSAAPRGPPALA